MGDTGTPKQVLVVEDESISRRALTRLLTAVGFQVVSVSSAEEAVERLKAPKSTGMRFDLALVDLDLPGMSGTELIQWMSERHPSLRSLLMTGAAEHRLRAALEKCPVPCLRKPLDFQHVISYITSAGALYESRDFRQVGY